MAQRRYFPGKDETWLLALRETLVEERAAGKVLTSWGSSDSNASKQIEISINERMRMVEWDLYVIDPDEYPLNRRIRRTQGRVYQGGIEV